MSDLIKQANSVAQLPDQARNHIAATKYADIKTGDHYISNDYVIKVLGFFVQETPDGQSADLNNRLMVIYTKAKDFLCTKWEVPTRTSCHRLNI